MNLRYGRVYKFPRKLIKYGLAGMYPFVIKYWPLPDVRSIDETLDKIIKEKYSISRFGDGEFLYIIDKLNLPFQKYNKELSNKLATILKSDFNKHMVALPNAYHSLENLNRDSLLTWKSQISWIYPRLKKYLIKDKVYYNANITRLYMPFNDKSKSASYFEKIMNVWKGREVLLVEGEKSRLGVGNDLFAHATKLERILVPMHHAFSKYKEILLEVQKHSTSKLVLLAIGPTATVISYELAVGYGYQAIDIGNLDLEYEWYKRGSSSRVKIPGKYTSEAIGGRIVEDMDNSLYKAQTIAKIL